MKRNFYTVVQLSKNMFLDNDGTLVCKNAVLGKVGTQAYSARELGLDSSEVVLIHRPENEVFDEQSLASLKGKALTLMHPDEDVSIDNYQSLAKGIIMDVRREGNLMIGDIRVTDKEVIDLIRSKKMVELSLGYDTKLKYEDGSDKLIQTDIVYNHVALVPKGRAEVARLIDEMNKEHQIRDKQLEMEEPMEDKNKGLIAKLLETLGLKKHTSKDGVDLYELPVELSDNKDEEVENDTQVENDKTDEETVTVSDDDSKKDGSEGENTDEVTVVDEKTDEPDTKTVSNKIDSVEVNDDTIKTTNTQVTDENISEDDEEKGEKHMDKFDELIANANKLKDIEDEELKKALKDQLLAEFLPKEEVTPEVKNENVAFNDFANLSFKDSDVEKFDFDGEFEKMLNDISPDSYENYGEYKKARKRIGRETSKEALQKLTDQAFEGGIE